MTGVASISHGKDSLAMLEAIKILGLPLDRIITVDIWATDTIRGELPPMVEFKEKADAYIFNRYGIKIEHLCANRGGCGRHTNPHSTVLSTTQEKAHIITDTFTDFPCDLVRGATQDLKSKCKTNFEEQFYSLYQRGAKVGRIHGFPMRKGNWCNALKMQPIRDFINLSKVRWCSI